MVFYGGTSWDGVVSADRPMATALSEYADILWVDPPLSPLTRGRSRYGTSRLPRPVLRAAAPGISRLTPAALPLHTRPVVRASTAALVRRQIRWALRRTGLGVPHAVISCVLTDIFRGWPRQVWRVIYGTDDWVAGARLMGHHPRWIAADERRLMARADLVVAISSVLADRWRPMTGTVVTVPNGVNTAVYEAAEALPPAELPVPLPPPVVGVIGNLSERIDIGLLEAVAAAGLSLLLVGPVDPRWEPERWAALLTRPGVVWLDRQPFEAIPALLKRVDVGITPYRDSEFNRASFPLKTLEYLAAGLPVVSTDLPAVRWLDTDLIGIADRPDEFVAAVNAAAARSPVPAEAAARREFAQRHSWASRAREVALAVDLPVG
jgi:teichuronic acid biosynthesis glycosyltransferase TuaH